MEFAACGFFVGLLVGFILSRYGCAPPVIHLTTLLTPMVSRSDVDDDISRHARDEFEGE